MTLPTTLEENFFFSHSFFYVLAYKLHSIDSLRFFLY